MGIHLHLREQNRHILIFRLFFFFFFFFFTKETAFTVCFLVQSVRFGRGVYSKRNEVVPRGANYVLEETNFHKGTKQHCENKPIQTY